MTDGRPLRICVPDLNFAPVRWAATLSRRARSRMASAPSPVTKDEIRDLFASDLAASAKSHRVVSRLG